MILASTSLSQLSASCTRLWSSLQKETLDIFQTDRVKQTIKISLIALSVLSSASTGIFASYALCQKSIPFSLGALCSLTVCILSLSPCISWRRISEIALQITALVSRMTPVDFEEDDIPVSTSPTSFYTVKNTSFQGTTIH